jgi:GDSL-like Lipase/Acylhydrolase family
VTARRRRSRFAAVRAVAVALLIAALLAACAGSPSESTLPREKKGPAPLYVALGGDDNGAGRRQLAAAWPQILFRTALPRGATFVNLSVPRAGIADVLATEVDEAVRLHPDVVTITMIDDAERGSTADHVEADLTEVVRRLRARRSTKVLIGTIPDGVAEPAITGALDQAIARVATATSSTLVDLGSLAGPRAGSRDERIADAFARALRAAGVPTTRTTPTGRASGTA